MIVSKIFSIPFFAVIPELCKLVYIGLDTTQIKE